MLEEVTMEKKSIRSVSSPKGTAETKKNQDVVAGKTFPKSTRKREKPGPKSESSIKKPGNSTPKNKHNHRRSAPRSTHHASGGKNSELVELDDDFDLRGSKKRNLTHLLNFHCKPRENAINTSRRSIRSVFPNTIRNLMSTQIHKYNKEQFLQANCQFVVKEGGDYSVYLADPNILVDWQLIEQIIVSSSEPVTCPICLDVPSAGKITRCGHVYCWSCILHYMAFTDNSWQKCPICFESIHKKDLKSVKLLNQNVYSMGDEIRFQLMKREQGTTVAIPYLELSSRKPNVLLPVSGDGHSIVYSKLLLGNHENILQIIEIEENELKRELKENEGCPEICFVEQAVQMLSERKKKLIEGVSKDNSHCSMANTNNTDDSLLISFSNSTCMPGCAGTSKEVKDDVSIEGNVPDQKTNVELQTLSEQELRPNSSEETFPVITAEDYEINISPTSVPIKESFFYQANDGQQIFLHSINARMLELQYGGLEHSPYFIKGKIVEIEIGSMTNDLRKRLRHLQHLPTTCQFQVVEIEFMEPIIKQEILIYFKGHLEERSRRREKRSKEEKKLQKKAEQLAKQQYGSHSPPRRLRLDSLHHFPECGSDTPPNVSPSNKSPVSSRTSSPLSTISRRSVSPVSKSMNSLSLNNTFAQKLKESNKDGVWRKRVTVSESEASTSHSRNLISDAVEVALLKARMEKESDQRTSGKNKKKKRQKSIPLCSVGMVYSNR